MKDGEVYMISFSGGRSSAYMTDRLLRELPEDQRIVCFSNTGKEKRETLDFVDRCDRLWGGVVNWLEYDAEKKYRLVDYATASREGQPFEALIRKRGYLPNVVARFCTQDLKIRPIKWFMLNLGFRYWTNVVGIRYDEPARWSKTNGIAEKERWEIWLPMVDWKVTKPMVLDFWKTMPFDLRLEHYQGNCDLCFLKGRNKMKRLITENPEKAEWWIRQEEMIGSTFNKRYSIRELVDLIRRSPTLFDYEDPDIDCICNTD
ncbi:MAG: phosphoadenosine phosphosulfate reductase family protein [Puia sp.]|nr:phosphoadenosine phosphosulfate reductase family protein [Puia sp.]